MAFARYFDKAALSAAAILKDFDYGEFRRRLEAQVVGVGWDEEAQTSSEALLSLDLLVNLLARLYPRLALIGPQGAVAERLKEVALRANAAIGLEYDAHLVTVGSVVGNTPALWAGPSLYIGSEGWRVRTSASSPVGGGTDSAIPFGAGVAACLGAAAVFRWIFSDGLQSSASEVESGADTSDFSVLDLRPWAADVTALPRRIEIDDTYLVGCGAIGNGVVWALSRLPGLKGDLYLIDPEEVDGTNAQRYVLVGEADEGASKVRLAARAFDDGAARLKVHAVPLAWRGFISSRGDYHISRALLALDSAHDRVAVQASLPRWVANAWTQAENLGVSRHEFIGERPCVACLYLPSESSRPSLEDSIVEALRVEGPEERMEVRRLLYYRTPVGREFLIRVGKRLGLASEEALVCFSDQSLEAFYQRAVCGGVILSLAGAVGPERRVEVPMAFQSALAGILLAVELVADAASLRVGELPARTEIDIRKPVADVLRWPHSPARKDATGRCLCADPVYQSAYAAKYDAAPISRRS